VLGVDHRYVYDLVPRLAVEQIRDAEGYLLRSLGYSIRQSKSTVGAGVLLCNRSW